MRRWKTGDRVSTDAGDGEILIVFDEGVRWSCAVQWDGTSSRGLYQYDELRPVRHLHLVESDSNA